MRRHLFSSRQMHLLPLFWESLVGFRLPRATPGNETERRIYGEWVKTPVPFSPVCGPKFTKLSEDVLSNSFVRLSMSRFIQKIFVIKSRSRRKTKQRVFDPQFLGRVDPPRKLLARFTVRHLAKFC